MKLGLIGYPLGHSWSPEIHAYMLGVKNYELWQLEESELDDFFARKDFDGINVTIPYKEKVIQYLDEIDPAAAEIGAVNTIVNTNGRLKGYNTDYNGFCDMLKGNGISVEGKHVAIIGDGGVSKAVRTAIRNMGGTYDLIGVLGKPGTINHEQMYVKQASYAVVVNACPVGMAPKTDGIPVDLDRFENVEAVVDVIANPLRTRLRFEAEVKGLPACGGFEMLVRQAYVADIFFTGKAPGGGEKIYGCMNYLFRDRRNVVIVGNNAEHNSTIAAALAKASNKKCEVMAADEETAAKLKQEQGIIIACGSETVKNHETMRHLAENGIVIYLQEETDCDKCRETYGKYSEASVVYADNADAVTAEIMRITGEKE